MAGIKHGKVVMVEVRQSRNLAFHRQFWALMTLVHQNLPEDRAVLYPTLENFVDAVKIAAGLRESITMPNGTVYFRPGSIAFHQMDEIGFADFYNRVCLLLVEHWLPGVTDAELKNEVSLMVGAA